MIPPLTLLIAVTARNFSLDPNIPHLYSGFNYLAGALLVKNCMQAHLKAQIEEAK